MTDFLETARSVLNWLGIANGAIMFVCLFIVVRRGWSEVGEPPTKAEIGAFLNALAWLVLMVLRLLIDLALMDWVNVLVDVGLIVWMLWVLFGRGGWWKRMRRRLKERVAVIRGRLKIVPIHPSLA